MTRADWGLLLLLCFVIGVLFHHFWTPRSEARSFTVNSPDGIQTYPLDEDRQFEVPGPMGATLLQVEDGAVRFVASPCRHKICVRSGWHRHGGAVAACVPNRISLVLQGENAVYDALSY